MEKNIHKKLINDKYYKKYNYLFNYSYNKFNLINQHILLNYNNNICNIHFLYSTKEQTYNNIIQKKNSNYRKYEGFNFTNFILKNYKKKQLLITNNISIIRNILFNKNHNFDIILYDNNSKTFIPKINIYINEIKEKINYNNILYSSYHLDIYKQFLINLKTNNEENNISIPKYKYDFISCHLRYALGLGLTASYKMILTLSTIISTIAMALKNIAKDGTLLLFWTIVNVNIPVIKKILSILAYGFKTVEIIDNDINQNLLIGVPEYYIKCEGYKDNISNELINKLLDIAIETVEYTYDVCDILDYYEDYTKKNPNHSLFYNKIESQKGNENAINSHTKKLSSNHSHQSSYSLTKKASHSIFTESKESKESEESKESKSSKPITPIYYIEDINIPELDIIMKNSSLQFEVSLLMNKLEGIFVGYFKMVNNLILNAIAYDKNGVMYVKKEAILQKDITNLSKLINMFEYNKLPYNKHALNVVLNKQDEILEHFYSLNTPVNQKLIKYEDKTSKILVNHALEYFKSYTSHQTKKNSDTIKDKNIPYNFNMINEYYNRIKIALQVKHNLLSDVSNYEHKTPKSVEYILHDFAGGLCQYLNNKYKTLPIQIGDSFVKLWEILSIFNLIPTNSESLKVLHLCEAPGQMILSVKYWVESKCPKLDMSNYEWMANTLNPYEAQNRYRFDTDVSRDMYGLIKHNYDKWLFGDDNSGDITKPSVIKSIMMDIKLNWLKNKKLDLIISDGSISFTNNDKLIIQKLDFAQVVSVLACSSIGGNCCIKHFIPYVNLNDPNLNISGSEYSKHISESVTEGSGLFISYLYLYYVSFDYVSFYKPNSSKSDSSEFYVVCKGFRGIEESYLDSLLSVLNNFELNDVLIDIRKIPETFMMQIKNFLESMSNINIITIEKENLLLTCYKNVEENNKKVNSVLKCNNFFDKDKIDGITIPKYKEWIKIYDFQ
jgi:hypothetical protein